VPEIGEVLNDPLPGLNKKKHTIAAVVESGKIAMFFNNGDSWLPMDLVIVDYRDCFKRTPFDRRLLEVLWESCILIFGIGTGGATVALELARAGVGHLKLADPSRFHIENVSRHECDLLDLERYKVNGCIERIKRINPKIDVEVFPYDVFAEGCPVPLDSVLAGVDLVVGATDKTSIQLAINAEAWKRGIPALFGGCYEEARGGELLFTLPGEGTPCLECLRGGLAQPETGGQIDYSLAKGYEDYKGEPGLHASVCLVTNIECMFALALLLRNQDCELAKLISPAQNYMLVGGALGADFHLFKRPFHIFSPRFMGPRRGCSVCQKQELSRSEKGEVREAIQQCEEVPDDVAEFL